MDKLTMAHEWYMKNIDGLSHDGMVLAFKYAEEMQAEADKLAEAERKTKREYVRELLDNNGTSIEKEGQHFDDVEWQPDWSQAPDNTTHWCVELGTAYWLKEEEVDGLFCKISKATSFGYTGNWQNSLRKRPEGK